jgi:hypothetical protein
MHFSKLLWKAQASIYIWVKGVMEGRGKMANLES